MKNSVRALAFFMICATACFAVTQQEIDAWKARAPNAGQSANQAIKQVSADCVFLARQATIDNLTRTLAMMRAKADTALAAANETLRSTKPGSRANGQAYKDAKEARGWISGSLLGFIASGEALAKTKPKR